MKQDVVQGTKISHYQPLGDRGVQISWLVVLVFW